MAATRCERAALHAVQEQVRRAAWAAAGLRYAHAVASHVKAKPPGAGGGAVGDGFEEGWAGLARLVQARAALVAAAQAAVQAWLAGLRTHVISLKVGAGYYSRLPLGWAEGVVGGVLFRVVALAAAAAAAAAAASNALFVSSHVQNRCFEAVSLSLS